MVNELVVLLLGGWDGRRCDGVDMGLIAEG